MSRNVFFESMASGDILVDENGEPLNLDFEPPVIDLPPNFNARGPWDPAGLYAEGDVVSYNNALWRAISAIGVAGVEPGVEPVWFEVYRASSGSIIVAGHTIREGATDFPAQPNLGFADTASVLLGVTNVGANNETRVKASVDEDWLTDKMVASQSATSTPAKAWVDIPLDVAAGFTQPPVGSAEIAKKFPAQMRINEKETVEFRGFFLATTTGMAQVALLPEGWRPGQVVRLPIVRGDDTIGACRIEPGGEVYYLTLAGEENHLDDVRFPLSVTAVTSTDPDFQPLPENPYKVALTTSDSFWRVTLSGSGVFAWPRTGDSATVTFDVPALHGSGTVWAYPYAGYVTYTVLDGPNKGHSGLVTDYNPNFGTPGSFTLTLPPEATEGRVRIDFVNVVWTEGFAG